MSFPKRPQVSIARTGVITDLMGVVGGSLLRNRAPSPSMTPPEPSAVTGLTRMKSIALVSTPPTNPVVSVDGVEISSASSPRGRVVGLVGGSTEARGLLLLRDLPIGRHRVVVSGDGVSKSFDGDFAESVEWDGNRFDDVSGAWPSNLSVSVLYFEDIDVSIDPASATVPAGEASSVVFRVTTRQLGGVAPFDVSLSLRDEALRAKSVVAAFDRSMIRAGQGATLTLSVPSTVAAGDVSFEVVATATGGGSRVRPETYVDSAQASLAIGQSALSQPDATEDPARDEESGSLRVVAVVAGVVTVVTVAAYLLTSQDASQEARENPRTRAGSSKRRAARHRWHS